MRRPLDPSTASIGVDANALNKDGSGNDALVDRFLDLKREGKVRPITPHGVRREVQHPRTPQHVSGPMLSGLYTLPTELTAPERQQLNKIEKALQGNARLGKHADDAKHLFDAGKHCAYFITHDKRILKRSHGLDVLPPSLTVVTLAEFLKIYDDYETGRRT